ncbi:MAG TPA: hypothetical protein VHO91_21105 [Rhodopila sp.]|nr:hypothetical protein [Rhodopila sp.]
MKVITLALAVVLAAAAGVAVAGLPAHRSTAGKRQMPASAPSAQQTTSAAPGPQQAAIDSDVRALEAMSPVESHPSRCYPAIPASQAAQPDLFARAFTDQLLTLNFNCQREDLLSWIQAESASSSEHLVVGLVPKDLRDKLAVYSLTQSSDGSAVPVPTASEWAAWRGRSAYTTGRIQKTFEPPQWSDAVASGQLSDAGITERQVDAEITTHWKQGSRVLSANKSISLVMNIEGPPHRARYGFVTAVIYQEVPA